MGLSVDSVSYAYGAGTAFEVQALNRVSLSIEPGELLLVLGATGSGKSTLLRVCAGLIAAESGSSWLDGTPLTRASARGVVGLVFQDAESQLFSESVLSDVEFGPRNLGLSSADATARARVALATVGLDPDVYGARSPFSLSGGEARRAAIAGVVAMAPRYLLLDEPTAGLDARGRRALHAAVRGMREHAGIVVVTHSAEEFLGEANRVLLLKGGEVAFEGTSDEVRARPEVFAEAGLIAPDMLHFQMAARARGAGLGAFELDPVTVAANIGRAKGWG